MGLLRTYSFPWKSMEWVTSCLGRGRGMGVELWVGDYFRGRHLGYGKGTGLNSDIRGKSRLSHVYFLYLVEKLC